MPLLKRLQGLAKSLENQNASSASAGVERRPSSADFSVQQSALTRTIGWHVGRGASSGLLQEVASAAVEESGASHVTASTRWAATLGAAGRRPQHIEQRLSKAVSSSKGDAPLRCPLSAVSVLMKDVRVADRRQQGLERQLRCRVRRGLLRARQPKKKSARAKAPCEKAMQLLPVLLPHVFFKNMVSSGLISELAGTVDWLEWWKKAQSEPWGMHHPVQAWSEEARSKAVAVSVHGDEGTGKRSKSVLVISFSPLAIHRGDSMLQKFPYCVVRADRFVYQNAKNVTLERLQRHFADSFKISGNPEAEGNAPHGQNAGRICPRCYCDGSTPGKHWADMQEGWDNPGDLQQAAADCVGPNIPMWRIPGYHHSCEYPDLLHCLYLGTVRDATASHVMELATYCPQLQAYETWDERLHHLHGDFQMWCKEHQFRPSLLDGLKRHLV